MTTADPAAPVAVAGTAAADPPDSRGESQPVALHCKNKQCRRELLFAHQIAQPVTVNLFGVQMVVIVADLICPYCGTVRTFKAAPVAREAGSC